MTPLAFPRPCLNCGVLTQEGNRCSSCQKKFDESRPKRVDSPERKARKRWYYDSTYQRKAEIVRKTATHCHLCGGGPRPDDPFQADHVIPGDKSSPLAPAHRSCNASKGNQQPKPRRQR